MEHALEAQACDVKLARHGKMIAMDTKERKCPKCGSTDLLPITTQTAELLECQACKAVCEVHPTMGLIPV